MATGVSGVVTVQIKTWLKVRTLKQRIVQGLFRDNCSIGRLVCPGRVTDTLRNSLNLFAFVIGAALCLEDTNPVLEKLTQVPPQLLI